jgi:hypothetical protein
MATTSSIRSRIDGRLHLLLAEIEELPATADEWNSLEDWQRASISLEWDHMMADYLTEADEYYRSGEMAPDQQARYRHVLCKLREVLPVVERLNFYPPPVSLQP